MKRVALIIQYNGTPYSGWQKQKNSITVQEILERALLQVSNHSVNTSVNDGEQPKYLDNLPQ